MGDSGGFGTTRTTCPYCGVGCGVLARRLADGTVDVVGDTKHPANLGRLCSKGSALGETVGLDNRLLYPEVDGHRVSWDAAISVVADRFRKTIERHGPDSVAFYVSGQLLTEDYYVANKLMKGFIGSANIDTNSRLCMASSVAGHKRAFGADTVPGTYTDLEQADLVVLTGSNLAWCHPVLFQRLLAARQARPQMKIVVIDPRRTATAEMADLHLPIAAGGDVALFNGLLCWLFDHDRMDADYVTAHTDGLDSALAAARQSVDGRRLTRATGLTIEQIQQFYSLFAETSRTVTVYSQGINQAQNGTDRVNAILNCHLLTGRIGRPGMGPFSVTGQPNAMGGREVGGLANQLACHMEIADPGHRELVQRFWDSPVICTRPGLKAVDLFKAIGDGKVKAVWIIATNPAVSLPEADRVRAILKACPFVVVSDVERRTDTAETANVMLPALGWGEKDGTVTNSERCISRQRAFMPPPGEARADWRIICDVATAMGYGHHFDYAGPADIFDEFARLSAAENNGSRDFDIGGRAGLDAAAYERMPPFQWPLPATGAKDDDGERRFFAQGGFYTPDRKGRFVAVEAGPQRRGRRNQLRLNTGRIRDHWHTMTRTARSPRLSQHLAEPFAEMHPDDAAHFGLRDADLAVLHNEFGRVIIRVLATTAQMPGDVFVPMHWTDQWTMAGRVDSLIEGVTDPVSGQPASKNGSVEVRALQADWYGFAVSVAGPDVVGPDVAELAYWALAAAPGGRRLECAGFGEVPEGELALDMLGFPADDRPQVLQYRDMASGHYRMAAFRNDVLVGAFFAGPSPVAVERSWLVRRLGQSVPDIGDRARLLAGRPGNGDAAPGALICSCNGVGARTIERAIVDGACSVAAVGEATEAGTGCGSCKSEIQKMLKEFAVAEAV